MAWRGFPGCFPCWYSVGPSRGVRNQAPPAAPPPKHPSTKPWNGLGWDEPHRPAGSTLLPRFLQSSIPPGQLFPTAGALQHPRRWPTSILPHPAHLFPSFQTPWLGWRPGHCQVLTMTSSPRGVVSVPELLRCFVWRFWWKSRCRPGGASTESSATFQSFPVSLDSAVNKNLCQ
ncbi:hypothetical protein RLOC_00010650 [Lonchura striata]|uniref:Uncharacterized protein n=1 Tax=Lonchura striata TaxID=40157 RepID=A0A218UEK5_9PASE|nr:hypothetical protein RLOC_00010650 [Lonchura striata domestica]